MFKFLTVGCEWVGVALDLAGICIDRARAPSLLAVTSKLVSV